MSVSLPSTLLSGLATICAELAAPKYSREGASCPAHHSHLFRRNLEVRRLIARHTFPVPDLLLRYPTTPSICLHMVLAARIRDHRLGHFIESSCSTALPGSPHGFSRPSTHLRFSINGGEAKGSLCYPSPNGKLLRAACGIASALK